MSFHESPQAQEGQSSSQWWCIAGLSLTAFVCGWVGFWRYEHEHGLEGSPLSPPYHALQMFILHTPHLERRINAWLEVGRWLAPLALGWAAVRAWMSAYRRELRLIQARRLSGHTVVCGLGRKGLDVLQGYAERGEKVLAVERAGQSDLIRAAEALGLAVVVGDATDPRVLRQARVHKAERLVAICGEDGTNVEIAVRARRLIQQADRRRRPLRCYVQLSDPALGRSVQHSRVLGGQEAGCDIRVFDIYESQVRALLEQHPLDRSGIGPEDPRQVHLVIVGFGRLGESLAVKAAQIGHFANRKPLRISAIDRTAAIKRDRLLFRYPPFEQVCPIEFFPLEVESPEARRRLTEWCQDDRSVTTVAICFDNDSRSLDVGFRLITQMPQCPSAIALRLSAPSGLASLLIDGGARPEVTCRLHAFGAITERSSERAFEDTELDALARAIHEDFVTKRTTFRRTVQTDRALASWDVLDDQDYKSANRQQADHLGIKLRAIGCEAAAVSDPRPEHTFSAKEVELLAEMEHARWVAERTLAGWTFGPRPKDDTAKTSPYLLPWTSLADDVKQYDRDAVLNIPNVLRIVRQKAVRRIG